MTDLIDRIEAATGADRELDAAIYAAVHIPGARIQDVFQTYDGWRFGYTLPPKRTRLVTRDGVPAYTASIDAAMGLVPEGADSGGIRFNVECWNDQSVHAPHVMATAWVAGAPRVFAATPALALCAAALKARESEG